jgi:hypothetical protein
VLPTAVPSLAVVLLLLLPLLYSSARRHKVYTRRGLSISMQRLQVALRCIGLLLANARPQSSKPHLPSSADQAAKSYQNV